MLAVRSAITAMQPYHPPMAGRQGLRLDFNESLAGCSPGVLSALAALTPEQLATYPEREPAERQVAALLGVAAEQALLTNGVDEAIHLVCEAYLAPGDEAVIPVPAFGMYNIYAAQTGATVVPVPCASDFRMDAAAILAALSPRTRVVLIANPNNPTGSTLAEADLLRIAAAAPQAAVLVDEAYFEFHGETLLPRLRNFPNLFVARTFSKAFGMAGLRVGCLCGDAAQLAFLRKIVSAYNVNAAALAALPVALRHPEWTAQYVAEVKRQRTRVQGALSEAGMAHWPSAGNFVLCRIGPKAAEFCSFLRQRGILVRDRSSDYGCAGCVRITIGLAAQMDRLLAELPEALQIAGTLSAREVRA